MKRFRSPLQKIHRIQEQQLLLSELALAQAQAAFRSAEMQRLECEGQIQTSETAFAGQLQGRTGLRSASVLSSRSHLVSCQHRLARLQEVCALKQREVLAAQAEYQQLKARLDGVSQVLEGQKLKHRRQALLTEQVQLDEASTALKLRQADRPIHNGVNQ